MGFDFKKFSCLILLYAFKNPIKRTRLNKLLFFCDVLHLLKYNRAITNAKYYKMSSGPVPEYIDEVINELIGNSFLKEEVMVEYTNYACNYKSTIDETKFQFILDSWFNDSEREIIRMVSDKLNQLNTSELSRKAHEFEPWRSANWNEELDLNKCVSDNNLRTWFGLPTTRKTKKIVPQPSNADYSDSDVPKPLDTGYLKSDTKISHKPKPRSLKKSKTKKGLVSQKKKFSRSRQVSLKD